MVGQTPAASVSERSLDYYWYGPSAEDVNAEAHVPDNHRAVTDSGPVVQDPPLRQDRRRWLRGLNAALHAVPCLVLLGIVGYAMRVLKEDMMGYKR